MLSLLLRSVVMIFLFLPALAHAHGDDHLTLAGFIGPAVAVIVFVAVVGLGRMLLRMIIKRA